MRHAKPVSMVSGMSLRQAALVTGVAYLLNPVIFAEAYAMPLLIASDAAQTVANMATHPHLFSAAVLSYFVGALADVVIAWSLYVLLTPVNRALALLASLLRLTFAAIWLAAISNLGLLYRLVNIPDYSRHVSAAELPSRAIELLGGFRSGWGLGLILFGLHLVGTGWLIVRSTNLPRWLGLAAVRRWRGLGRRQLEHLSLSKCTYRLPESYLCCGVDLHDLAARLGLANAGSQDGARISSSFAARLIDAPNAIQGTNRPGSPYAYTARQSFLNACCCHREYRSTENGLKKQGRLDASSSERARRDETYRRQDSGSRVPQLHRVRRVERDALREDDCRE